MFWYWSEDISVLILALALLCLGQAVVGDESVPGCLGVGVVRPGVVSVVVGEVSIIVPTTVESTPGVVPVVRSTQKK